MATAKDSASVTSSSGFFKRLSRKRSIGPSSPTSPSAIPDSAPWLPPLEGIEAEQALSSLPAPVPHSPTRTPAKPPTASPRASKFAPAAHDSRPPILNLPGDIAPPVASKQSTFVPIVKGGPQLPPPKNIDTSLHLEVTPSGFLALPSAEPTPTVEKKEAQGALGSRATSPSPSKTPEKKAAAPAATPSPRKEASTTSERSAHGSKESSLTKTLGAIFRRSKGHKEGSDWNAASSPQPPTEDAPPQKRRSVTASFTNPLRRNSFTPSKDAPAVPEQARANGAEKEKSVTPPPPSPKPKSNGTANAVETNKGPDAAVVPAPVPAQSPAPEPAAEKEATPVEEADFEPVPEPIAKDEPIVVEQKAATPEPVVENAPTPEPKAPTPEPVVETPEPVVEDEPEPEPVHVEREPTPEPVVEKAHTPKAPTPEPVVEEPTVEKAPTPEPAPVVEETAAPVEETPATTENHITPAAPAEESAPTPADAAKETPVPAAAA
ncbi:hypothetical protein AURDEDRAFT_114546 [Auricularia subglabra TFB-10046 SS5]|nr:hypothetical protein AURDEDRAFT_114546 [Auricularia subglabra TFB-10046 SS5]